MLTQFYSQETKMPVLLLILLLIIYLGLLRNKLRASYLLFGLFLILWLAIFIPHTIHYVNVQL